MSINLTHINKGSLGSTIIFKRPKCSGVSPQALLSFKAAIPAKRPSPFHAASGEMGVKRALPQLPPKPRAA